MDVSWRFCPIGNTTSKWMAATELHFATAAFYGESRLLPSLHNVVILQAHETRLCHTCPLTARPLAPTLPQKLLSPAHSPNLTSSLEKDTPGMIQHGPEHEDATDAVEPHEEVPASNGRTPQEMPDVMPLSATSTPLMTQLTIPTSNTIPESPP